MGIVTVYPVRLLGGLDEIIQVKYIATNLQCEKHLIGNTYYFYWKSSMFKMRNIVAAHSSILVWRIPMDRGAWQATVHSVTHSHT